MSETIATTMVVTLRSGTQIRIGVKEFTVQSASLSAELRGLKWVPDDNPAGSSLPWLDLSEVAAVHAERTGSTSSPG